MAKDESPIRSATREEYEEVTKFCGKIFRKNFVKLLPKIYKERPINADHHYVYHDVRGNLRGSVASLPVRFCFGYNLLNAYGIGMVSTHPMTRGRGIMSRLMRFAIREAVASGADLMFLSGMHQRYEHFGFSPVLPFMRGVILKYNVARSGGKGTLPEDAIDFIKIKSDFKDMDRLYEIFEAQEAHAERDRDRFFDTLISWRAKAHAVTVSGEVKGYIITRHCGFTIDEICLTESVSSADVIRAYFNKKHFGGMLFTKTPVWDKKQLAEVTTLSHQSELGVSANIKVLNFKRVIEVLLSHKAKTQKLVDGVLKMQIGDTKLQLIVKNDDVAVDNTTELCDIEVTDVEANYILFSAVRRFDLHPLITAWFPLPFTVPHADNV